MNRLEEIYNAFPNVDWEKNINIHNPNLYLNFFLKIYDKLDKLNKENYRSYITNGNIIPSPEIIKQLNIDKISKCDIEQSIYLTVNDILQNPFFNYDVEQLSYFCSSDIYLSFPSLNWDYFQLSSNKNITIDIIKSQPNKPWKFNGLSSNPNLTIEYFLEKLDKPWNFKDLSNHRIITLEIVNQYEDLPWNISEFSRNINVDWDTVCNNPDMGWDYKMMSRNPNITWQNICENKHLSWDINYYCLNPSLTIDIIKHGYLCEWNFNNIGDNFFTFNRSYYLKTQQNIIGKSHFIIAELKTIVSKFV